ncbi:hypothetical protein KDW36_29630 [Burkholderia dolosa]|uniref:hypothetical protein n=1 Tax=Burkholderia dolosa TaxID=152500 RepID=UPI001B97CE0D|nr:hypothetical protein [Burkholderia dolosa]MBR8317319.1 hypothetical protein [Burkholderia dolosa]
MTVVFCGACGSYGKKYAPSLSVRESAIASPYCNSSGFVSVNAVTRATSALASSPASALVGASSRRTVITNCKSLFIDSPRVFKASNATAKAQLETASRIPAPHRDISKEMREIEFVYRKKTCFRNAAMPNKSMK